ncbi:hypothetical protein CKJ90_31965, partial [Klebsiella pneumoniae]
MLISEPIARYFDDHFLPGADLLRHPLPDLVTFAKGLRRLRARRVLISEPIARYFDDHFLPGADLLRHPL